MKLYGGIDLHSNNSYVVIIDETDHVIYQKRLPNDLSLIIESLKGYQPNLAGLVVESTYNWYWLVDGLQAAGYQVHLANTTAISQYSGLKYTDDKSDARWLAHLLRLGILAEGYIYPKGTRGLRELLRKRLDLVKQRTRCLLTIKGMYHRYENIHLKSYQIKRGQLNEEELLLRINDCSTREVVSSYLKVLNCINQEISSCENAVIKVIKSNNEFKRLKMIPGIGDILAMTVLLETGNIRRFAKVGNYSSYCRCVESKRLSNGKKKGDNNRHNGNAYLSWAFVEAAHNAIRHYPEVKRFYQRKTAKTKRVVAIKAIANKLAKACFYVLRDEVDFKMDKLFC